MTRNSWFKEQNPETPHHRTPLWYLVEHLSPPEYLSGTLFFLVAVSVFVEVLVTSSSQHYCPLCKRLEQRQGSDSGVLAI